MAIERSPNLEAVNFTYSGCTTFEFWSLVCSKLKRLRYLKIEGNSMVSIYFWIKGNFTNLPKFCVPLTISIKRELLKIFFVKACYMMFSNRTNHWKADTVLLLPENYTYMPKTSATLPVKLHTSLQTLRTISSQFFRWTQRMFVVQWVQCSSAVFQIPKMLRPHGMWGEYYAKGSWQSVHHFLLVRRKFVEK